MRCLASPTVALTESPNFQWKFIPSNTDRWNYFNETDFMVPELQSVSERTPFAYEIEFPFSRKSREAYRKLKHPQYRHSLKIQLLLYWGKVTANNISFEFQDTYIGGILVSVKADGTVSTLEDPT